MEIHCPPGASSEQNDATLQEINFMEALESGGLRIFASTAADDATDRDEYLQVFQILDFYSYRRFRALFLLLFLFLPVQIPLILQIYKSREKNQQRFHLADRKLALCALFAGAKSIAQDGVLS